MATTSSYPRLIDLYGSAGFAPDLVLGTFPMWLIATVGVYFNLVLVYTSITRRSLHYWCNLLIALDCANCAISELGPTATFGVVLFGFNWIKLSSCFWFLFIPNFGTVLSYGGMLVIAVERLLATLIITNEESLLRKMCISIMVIANAGMAIYYAIICLIYSLANPEILVGCDIGAIFPTTDIYYFTVKISLCISGCSALCYILIGIVLKYNLFKNEHSYFLN